MSVKTINPAVAQAKYTLCDAPGSQQSPTEISVETINAAPAQAARTILRAKRRLRNAPCSQQSHTEKCEMTKTPSPAEAALPIAQAKYTLCNASCSQQSQTYTSEEMEAEQPQRSALTLPSSQCPVSARSAFPLRSHHHCDYSKQRCIERFEMLLQKRALRVQSAHFSRRTESILDSASTSQEYFQLDVPKWSDFFPLPSDEKKISASSQRQNYKDMLKILHHDLPNVANLLLSKPATSHSDEPVTQTSSQVQAVLTQQHGHGVKRCLFPASVIVSDRSSFLNDILVGLPDVSTLVIGDSTLQLQIETPGTIVNSIKGARASDIKSKLNALADAKVRFNRIVIHLGVHEVKLRQSEMTKNNIKEVCDLAKTMSDIVICSGPLPSYWSDEIFSRLLALHDWMSKWCPQNNIGFIDNWKYFWKRHDLFKEDGLYPNWKGIVIFSENLTNSLRSSV